MSKDNKKSSQVFYDGDCPMCRNFMQYVGSDEQLQFKNLREEALPDNISKKDAIKKIHYKNKNGETFKGAKAVLKILEGKNKFKFIAKLGQLPIVSQIAELVYYFIANNRFLIFGNYALLFWIKIIITLGFLIPLFFTYNLWLGEDHRFYPTTPVFAFLPQVPSPLDIICLTILMVLLILILLTPKSQKLILSFLAFLLSIAFGIKVVGCHIIINFGSLFLILSQVTWNEKIGVELITKEKNKVIYAIVLLLVGIWFWSGIHKMNLRYFAVGFPWIMSPFTKFFSLNLTQAINSLSLITPFIEFGAALLLLFKKSRNVSTIILILMHMFILLCFGPFGLNFNQSVWSWNIAMILLLYLVFYNSKFEFTDLIKRNNFLGYLVGIVFCLFPYFNKFGIYDDFLSHALYSWSTKEAEIEILDKNIVNELPPELKPAIENFKNRQFIHVLNWSYLVFNSPPYHADRVFKNTFKKLCNNVKNDRSLELNVYEKPKLGKSVVTKYKCEDVV